MARKKNTRNAHGDGSIRERKDGRWEARYTAGRDPSTGKQIQRSARSCARRRQILRWACIRHPRS